MHIGHFLRTSGIAALAAALAITALPSAALAQRGGDGRGAESGERGAGNGGGNPGTRGNGGWGRNGGGDGNGGGGNSGGGWNGGGGGEAAARAPMPEARMPRAAHSGDGGRFERSSPDAEPRMRRVDPNDAVRSVPVPQTPAPGWTGRNGGDDSRRDRNPTYTDPDRNRSYDGRNNGDGRNWRGEQPRAEDRNRRDRDNNRDWGNNRDQSDNRDWNRNRDGNNDRNWRDNDRNWRDDRARNDNRNWNSNRNWNNRDNYRDARRDHRQWDRQWRSNSRYDWNRYRYSNHSIYRPGRYYSPYRDYSYRRLSIGFYLDSLFFGDRYWINDPWQYRLPDVYGPYRWVRYYDDVLLVDVYTGEVVDVIHDFFW